jgi:hypothetical protein
MAAISPNKTTAMKVRLFTSASRKIHHRQRNATRQTTVLPHSSARLARRGCGMASSDAPMMAPALLRVNDEVHGGDPKAKKAHGSFPSDLTDQVTQA